MVNVNMLSILFLLSFMFCLVFLGSLSWVAYFFYSTPLISSLISDSSYSHHIHADDTRVYISSTACFDANEYRIYGLTEACGKSVIEAHMSSHD